MLRRLAQQRMTLSDLKWPFHTNASRAVSAVAELLAFVCCFSFDLFSSIICDDE